MARNVARMDDLESQVWRDLIAVVELLPAALDAQLRRDAGITHFEFMVLSTLRLAEGPAMRAKELASSTNATLARLSHVLARLEERGLVERAPCPEDRRATNVSLTSEGRRVLIHALPGHLETVRALVLEPPGREALPGLADGLGRIAAGLDPHDRFLHQAPREPRDEA